MRLRDDPNRGLPPGNTLIGTGFSGGDSRCAALIYTESATFRHYMAGWASDRNLEAVFPHDLEHLADLVAEPAVSHVCVDSNLLTEEDPVVLETLCDAGVGINLQGDIGERTRPAVRLVAFYLFMSEEPKLSPFDMHVSLIR